MNTTHRFLCERPSKLKQQLVQAVSGQGACSGVTSVLPISNLMPIAGCGFFFAMITP
jgi:hypothetical protein